MPDPLTQSFFGEKILKRRKTPKRPDHFFLAQSIIFQILFSFFVKFNYSNVTPMVNPANPLYDTTSSKVICKDCGRV